MVPQCDSNCKRRPASPGLRCVNLKRAPSRMKSCTRKLFRGHTQLDCILEVSEPQKSGGLAVKFACGTNAARRLPKTVAGLQFVHLFSNICSQEIQVAKFWVLQVEFS